MSMSIQHPRDLTGAEIAAISFVRDYVEVLFDGPILRCISNPTVVIKGMMFRFPEPGSRDALCLLIGASVASVSLEEGKRLELTTERGDSLVVPLNDEAQRGGEAMHFLPGLDEPLQVW